MEYAIITLNINEYSCDLELPRFMKIDDMQYQIRLLLNQEIPDKFCDCSKIILLYNGNVLDASKDLASYKICTGDILECICK